MNLPVSRSLFFVLLGVCLSVFLYLINPLGLDPAAGKVISVGVLMVTLWVSEAIPMAVTALLPLVLFPLLKTSTLDATASAYSNKVIFLFLGGFMLGLAIVKWSLHRRIALTILVKTGTSGNRIVLGFILATGLVSMWLSNTATTMMMFPIALSVIRVMKENHPGWEGLANFSTSVMIAIALASNFGGISTIVGTPPNVAYAAYFSEKFNQPIDFSQWMVVGTPLAVLLLASLYFVLVKWMLPNRMRSDEATKELIHGELAELGKISKAEKRVLVVFGCTAFLWISKGLLDQLHFVKLDDNIIAVMGALALFIVPSGMEKNQALLSWTDTKEMAWGILLLFGGGIALANALEKAGLIEKLGTWFSQFAFSPLLLVFLVVAVSLFISEFMSNVAQVIVFAPVVSGLAMASGIDPLVLGLPMTLAASCASMLPMGTPPNAIAFSSGYISLKQMMRVGFILNLISILLITVYCYLVIPLIFY